MTGEKLQEKRIPETLAARRLAQEAKSATVPALAKSTSAEEAGRTGFAAAGGPFQEAAVK